MPDLVFKADKVEVCCCTVDHTAMSVCPGVGTGVDNMCLIPLDGVSSGVGVLC